MEIISKGKSRLSTIKVFLIFFGTIVGAGFASGREVYVYFARFGVIGLVMTIFAGILFFVLGYIFLQLGKKCRVNNINDFFRLLFGRFSHFFEIVIIFCYMIVLGAMFAGFDSLQKIMISNINFPIISIIGAILCVLITIGGVEKISKLNGILLPMLFVFMIAIFFNSVFCQPLNNLNSLFNLREITLFQSFGCCLIFVCSNMFLTGFILMKTGANTTNNVDKKASFLTGLILTIFTFFASLSIILNPISVQYDMPFVYLAFGVSNAFVILSVVILWLAIFTTAVATMFTITWWLNGYINNKYMSSAIICVGAFLLSRVGFSYIVDIFYPLTGFLDILFVISAIILYIKVKNNKEKQINNYFVKNKKKNK